MSFEIIVEFSQGDADVALLGTLAQEACAKGGASGRATLIMSGDFDRSVRSRLGVDAVTFTRDRSLGIALAKTMPKQRGDGFEVLVDESFGLPAAAARYGHDDLEWSRILAHEMWHVDVGLRQEPSRSPGAVPGMSLRDRFFSFCGWQSLDEYRVERVLSERANWPASSPDNVQPFLAEFENFTASLNGTQDDVNAVADLFPTLTRLLGYFAASVRPDEISDRDTLTLLEPFWSSPHAGVPSSSAVLAHSARMIAIELDSWLQKLGARLLSEGQQLFVVPTAD